MFISISFPMQFNCKLTVTSPIALQTTALKPPVFHYGRGAMAVIFQLQGSHVLKHNLLHLLFLSKWDQNVQNKHHHVLNTTEPQTRQETVYWANTTSDKQAHFLTTLYTIALLFQFSGVADGVGFTFQNQKLQSYSIQSKVQLQKYASISKTSETLSPNWQNALLLSCFLL